MMRAMDVLLLLCAMMLVASSSLSASASFSEASAAAANPTLVNRNVHYDNRSLWIDGHRQMVLSGAVHYARVPVQDWPRVFAMAKEMGLNTIQTYVMWNFHEHKQGVQDWSGRRNITAFIQAAADQDLLVVVRIGPYVCGEYYFGGIPIWVRDLDGIKCMRCADPVWEREMQKFVTKVVEVLTPQLASNGGPIITLQIENEYSGDMTYLGWAVDMARNLTTAVPWNLCHDVKDCSTLNANGDKVLCTINGFWEEVWDSFVSQPSPAWLDTHAQGNPTQPGVWTEDQGWFDQWGVAQRVRYSSDQIYGIARFFAYGGSWHNFYMLTGGNNYGRQSGGDVVTAYAPDTVIDNLFLRHEPRFSFYKKFFLALQQYSDQLLNNPIARAIPLNLTVSSLSATENDVTVTLTTCYQYPSASEMWTFTGSENGAGQLKLQGTNSCIASDQTHPVLLSDCTSDPKFSWTYDATLHHFASVSELPCQKTKGQQCHRCLDVYGGKSIDLWDCKPTGDPEQGNQLFHFDSTTSHIVSESTGQCVAAIAPTPPHSGQAEAHVYGTLAFLSNYDETQSGTVVFQGKSYYLTNHTVAIIDLSTSTVVFNTSDISDTLETNTKQPAESFSATSWEWFAEKPDNGKSITNSSEGPIEQLIITDNDSDYLWYETEITDEQLGGSISLSVGDGTRTYIYIDGVLAQKGITSGETSAEIQLDQAVIHKIRSVSPSATHSLQIFSCAMGMYNGGNLEGLTKGVNDVKINGKSIASQPFKHTWNMTGEYNEIYTAQGQGTVPWSPISTAPTNATLIWFKGSFDVPSLTSLPTNQTAFALDLSPMNKGVAYFNGFNLGRYYLLPGQCNGACAPPIHGNHCYEHFKGCGKPTQHLYHIPTEILQPTGNLVVLFEETAELQERDLSAVQLVKLTEHPDFN